MAISRHQAIHFVVLLLILFCATFSRCVSNGELGREYSLDINNPIYFTLTSSSSVIKVQPADSSLVGNYTLSQLDNVRGGYSLPADLTGSTRSLLNYLTIDLSGVTANLPSNAPVSASLTRLEIEITPKFPLPFNFDPSSYLLLIYNKNTNSFEYGTSSSSQNSNSFSVVLDKAYQTIVTFGIFAQTEPVVVSLGSKVPIYYPRSISYIMGGNFEQISFSFSNANYATKNTSGIFMMQENTDDVYSFPTRGKAVLGRFEIVIEGPYSRDIALDKVTVQHQCSSNMFYNTLSEKKEQIKPSTLSCYLADAYSLTLLKETNCTLTYSIAPYMFDSGKIRLSFVANLLNEPGDVSGVLGTEYSVEYNWPVVFAFPEYRVDVRILPSRKDSLLEGKLILRKANNVKPGYSIPAVYKDDRSPLFFLDLDLTNTKSNNPNELDRNILTIRDERKTPSDFNTGPSSYIILVYNEESNSFQNLDSGVMQAYQRVVTLGVFVNNRTPLLELGQQLAILYPRSVSYLIGTDLESISYSFPFAEWPYSPVSTLSVYLKQVEGSTATLVPRTYAILGRFQFSSDYTMVYQALNMTASYVSVKFQTFSNEVFYDFASKVVEVDKSSIGCMFEKGGNLVSSISEKLENGLLTCVMDNSFKDHRINIVAKLKSNQNQIMEVQGSLNSQYALDYFSPISYSIPQKKFDIKVFQTNAHTYLVGNASLSVSNNVRRNYILPNSGIKRNPLTGISFLNLDLTNVKAIYPENTEPSLVKLRTQISIKLNSWIPSLLNLDPKSYMILIYNEATNSFEIPNINSNTEYGFNLVVEDAYDRILTLGIFAYNQIEIASLSQTVPIEYPTTVKYITERNDLISVSYSFPSAECNPTFRIRSKMSLSSEPMFNEKLKDFVILERYHFSTIGESWNIASSTVKIEFDQTSSFLDISSKIVKVDPTSLSCFSESSHGTVFKSSYMANENGILTCSVDISNSHYMYIVAKVSTNPNPTPQPIQSLKPNPQPIPQPSSKPTPIQSLIPNPTPNPQPSLKPNPQPSSKPTPTPQQSVKPNPQPIQSSNPNPQPIPQPSSKPAPNPVPKPSFSSMKERLLVSSVSQQVSLMKSESTLFKYLVRPESTVTFTTTYDKINIESPLFFIASEYIPSKSNHDLILPNGSGSLKNYSKRLVTLYILIVNSEASSQSFSFTAKTEEPILPNQSNAQRNDPSNESLTIVYILVPLMVALFLAVSVALIIVIFLTRRRRFNPKESTNLNESLLNEMNIQSESPLMDNSKLREEISILRNEIAQLKNSNSN